MSRTIGLLVLASVTAYLVACGGCKRTKPNPNDTTPPVVEIAYRNSLDTQFKEAGETQDWGGGSQLDILCRFKDPDGIKSIAGDVKVVVKNCEDQHGVCQLNCSCPLPDPAPAYNQTLQPDQEGNVPTFTVYMTTVKAGTPPFCQNDPSRKVVGALYTVQCNASNFGNQQTQKAATFKFGVVGPC